MRNFFSKFKSQPSKKSKTPESLQPESLQPGDSDQRSIGSSISFSLRGKSKKKSQSTPSHNHDPQSAIMPNTNANSTAAPPTAPSNTIQSPHHNQQAVASSAAPGKGDQPQHPDVTPTRNPTPTMPPHAHAQAPPGTVPAIAILPPESEAIATPSSPNTNLEDLHKTALVIAKARLTQQNDLAFLDQLQKDVGWRMEVFVEELNTAHNNWAMTNGTATKRIGKILDSVEKYAKIVDIGIQHSPEITSLVWAGVRAILQIARNHSEAIESFEATIAIITDKMASCNFYATIYTEISWDSASPLTENSRVKMQNILDTALPKLWASVIVFSIKAHRYFDVKWIKKVGNLIKPFAIEFQPLIDEINESAEAVRECADGATMQRIKEHSEMLTNMEALLNNIKSEMKPLLQLNQISYVTAEVLRHTLSAEEDQLLGILSPLEPLKRHLDIKSQRLVNTGTWMLELQTFRSWCDGNLTDTNSRILCCYGMPGAGKTFISSLVIDHLEKKSLEQRNIAIACLYCDYRDQTKQTVLNILGTFIYQFLSRNSLPQIREETILALKKIKEEKKRLEVVQAVQILKAILQELTSFICIDALDELEPETLRQLLDIFGSKLKVDTTKIFLTGRPHIRNELNSYLQTEARTCLEIELTASPSDIKQYLAHKIAQDAISNSEAMNNELKEHILREITSRSEGMFLLPALQIDTVLDQVTRRKRMNALKTLPDGLYATYGLVMRRIKQSKHAELANQVFMWLHLAKQPLKANELQHALSVELDDVEFDSDNVPSQNSILASCFGLVIVDDETSTMRLVHYSLEEYFRKHTNEYFPHGPGLIAEICLTYLNFGEIRRRINREPDIEESEIENAFKERQETYPFLNYAALYWSEYYKQQSNNRTDELALKLLDHDNCPIQVMFRHLPSVLYNIQPFSGIHFAAFAGLTEIIRNLLVKKQTTAEGLDGNILVYAAVPGHGAVVRLLLEEGNFDINGMRMYGSAALVFAAKGGHEAVVRLLLEKENIDINRVGMYGRTALINAAQAGHEAVVRLLLEKENIDINRVDPYGATALINAAEAGHEAVVRLLLEKDNIDINTSMQLLGSTALMEAARVGHEAVVRLLLEKENIDINRVDPYGGTALTNAAEGGHEAVVRLLLEKENIDINTMGKTALICAAEAGHEAVVRLLLEKENIDVNMARTNGTTALIRAAEGGHEAVVRLLLEKKNIDFNTTDWYDRTALINAARAGREAVVGLLLEKGNININRRDDYGRTALMHAAEAGHKAVVRLLLGEENIDINTVGYDGTALMHAAAAGHEAVVRLLLEKENIDVNIARKDGKTALIRAAEGGHEAVVRLLLEKENININMAGTDGRTALSYAKDRDQTNIIELLLSRGAC